ncbi:MAG: hypothetical protein R3190_17335 [Thermoanaerobaculia bacterium]|nr:hypothetical protein [Thermoanaerobaculia bacterium]
MSKKLLAPALGSALVLAAAGLAGCARGRLPSESPERLLEIFRQLHADLYDVYDVGPDRDRLWELLAGSFTGEALTDQYVEQFATLVQMRRESTGIDVLRIDYESLEIVERRADLVVVEADWSVGGIVSHQRHKHPRVNRYRAVYTLSPAEADPPWRITDTRMRDLERVRSLSTDSGSAFDAPRSARGLLTAEDLLRAGVLEEDEEHDEEAEAGGGEAPQP